MTRPSMVHITACDGTTLTVTTRITAAGDLCVEVFKDKRDGPISSAEILTKAASHRTRV